MSYELTTAPHTTAYWITTCRWCGCSHTGVCPRVRAIEYHPNGQIARVEFHDTASRLGDVRVTIAPSETR